MTALAERPVAVPEVVRSAQATFRSVMNALARPGTLQHLPATIAPGSLMPGTAAIALSLFDHDTPVWLDPDLAGNSGITGWLKFHTGASVVAETSVAGFALVSDGRLLPQLKDFALGTSEYPDRSTTVILQVESLDQGPTFELRGPGIRGATRLQAGAGLPDLAVQLAINEALFPRGIDVLLVHDRRMVAIPRTARMTSIGG